MTRKKQKIFGGKYKKENCELLVPYYCKGNVFTNKEFGDTIFFKYSFMSNFSKFANSNKKQV